MFCTLNQNVKKGKGKGKETKKAFIFKADLPFSQERRISLRFLVAQMEVGATMSVEDAR